MPKLVDYHCRACGMTFEFLHHPVDEPASCVGCSSADIEPLAVAAKTLTVIVPTYRNCKRQKAGYCHTHEDRPAEKVSVSVPQAYKGGNV